MNTVVALLSSRKFWVGLLTIAATVGAVVLRVTDKIPSDALVPTIVAITATGLGVIGSIAWEDAALKGSGAPLVPPSHPSGETPSEGGQGGKKAGSGSDLNSAA